jgi:hypothetical protein
MQLSLLGVALALSLQVPSSPSPSPAPPASPPPASSSPATSTAPEAPRPLLPPKTQPRLFVVDIADRGVGADVVAAMNQAIQGQAVASHLGETVTQTQVRILLSAQASQQLVGCDSELCMTDVGKLIEADLILGGSAARAGDDVVLTLLSVDPTTGRRVRQEQRKVPLHRDFFFYAARQLTSLLLTGRTVDPRVPVGIQAVDGAGVAAEVRMIVDGKQVATASSHQLDLDPGQHELLLQRDGFVDWKSVIDVVEATPLQVRATLVPAHISLWPAAIATSVVAAGLGVAAALMADYATDLYAGTGVFGWGFTDAKGTFTPYSAANAYLNVVPTNTADLCRRELEISIYVGRATASGSTEAPFAQNSCGVANGPGLVQWAAGAAGLLALTTGVLVTAELLATREE